MKHHLVYLAIYCVLVIQDSFVSILLCSALIILYELYNWLNSEVSQALQSYFIFYIVRLEWLSHDLSIPIELFVPALVLLRAFLFPSSARYFISNRNIGLMFLIMLISATFKILAHFKYGSEIESWINLVVMGILLVDSFSSEAYTWNNKFISMLKLVGLLIGIRVLFAFLYGESLLLNSEVTVESAERYNFIFKATYYFSSFFYILGCSWLVYLIECFVSRNFFINMWAFIVITVVIILNFNLSLIFTLIILAGIFVLYNAERKVAFKIAALTLLLMMLASIGFSRLSYGTKMIDRLTLNETSSFDARLSVFESGFTTFLHSPFDMAFGMGSEALTRNESSHVRDYKWNSLFGQHEGTVDSNWLTFLFENGILISIILLFCIVFYLYRFKLSNAISLIIVMFLITGSTQIFLYSKVALLFYIPLITNLLNSSANSSRLY